MLWKLTFYTEISLPKDSWASFSADVIQCSSIEVNGVMLCDRIYKPHTGQEMVNKH